MKLSEYVFNRLKTCSNKFPPCEAPISHFFCVRINHTFSKIRIICTKGHHNIHRIENHKFKELQLPHELQPHKEEVVAHV